MKILSKTLTLVAASAILSLTMTGCGSSKPSDKEIQSAIDKNLDKAFISRNNHGEVFTVSNINVKDLKQKNKIAENTEYTANVTFTVSVDNNHPLAFNMFDSRVISKLNNLDKGQKHTFKNVSVEISQNKNGVSIDAIR